MATIIAALWVAPACEGLASSAPASPAQIAAWQREPLQIETRQGLQTFHVEIAADAETQRRGLMFRESLADDAGMLFLFGMDARRSFWMRNTPLSLDLIFIQSDGAIVAIVAHAEPESAEIISPTAFAASVLEIKAGQAAKLGIAVGDRVMHPALTAFENGAP